MKFVALISGGKDSFYNIFHCLKNNHELIALANLHPTDVQEQELDSFMFQTVGHDIIPLYSKCLGVPLLRTTIDKSSSKNVDLNYLPTKFDEIEKLYELLLSIKNEFPDLEAVSVGAILSSYQRIRVESVCQRLGLTVLSYLWQRDQLELMKEMCSMSKDIHTDVTSCCKFDARIIKVAAIGLDKSHLGKSLPVNLPTFTKLNKMYQVHICGEGGEFETMVLDAPFFKNGFIKLIQLIHEDPSVSDDGVYSAKFKVEFQERTVPAEELSKQLSLLPVPKVIDEKWDALLETYMKKNEEWNVVRTNGGDLAYSNNNTITMPLSIRKLDSLIFISNLTCNNGSVSVIKQAENVFEQLAKILNDENLFPSQTLYSSLILRDMSQFSKVNGIYNKFFNTFKVGPLPPSRACVGSELLANDCQLQLSIVLDRTKESQLIEIKGNEEINDFKTLMLNKNKDGLHVQGRSYWAPCNIGPYSQAIWTRYDFNKVTYISGQIGLIPASMNILDSSKEAQCVLALRHFDTLKETIDSKRQLFMTCFISTMDVLHTVCSIWSLYSNKMANESDSELWWDKENDPMESIIIVKVSQLPRNAVCEWGGVTCKEIEFIDDEYDSNDESDIKEAVELYDLQFLDTLQWAESTVNSNNSKRHFITAFSDDDTILRKALTSLERTAHIVLYYNATKMPHDVQTGLYAYQNIEFFPVEGIFDYIGNEHRYGMQIRY
ncbi:diphthine--ammonia ligase NDAI_0G02460 [Naumovozyma dairenensis CBS 421]|uniref:Diphthine--ammonia ligase n=1 Tax=Naumovozyma dairenensis (strain ATCC 10597 / BCRC 20456 / CBS 421 / NBRC 0211 / NRRL Y-12639) TaxID=1071378 RepID=G0WE10_NAUDC|nr:hypothetical protein NDAI_0G02460 [Naumovozyma dairenensis CBS 421]CCD26021.2 hypothetical protein NDAI_0G02460 [Naumovozyma dairenensis CBS 421]